MLRVRLTGVLVTFGLLIGGGAALRGTAEGTPAAAAVAGSRPAVLEILYTPPILVPAGERVLVPVDVICATASGRACSASVAFGVRAGSDRWRQVTTAAAKGLRFDVTAAANRAAAGGRAGRVEFFIRARAVDGRVTALGSSAQPLAFYVASDLARVRVSSGAAGRPARGRTVLFVPWGSGPNRAGLQAGPESATLGPSSFDVELGGRVHVVDVLQRRVATFDHGHLTGQIPLRASSPTDVAVAPDGATYLAQRVNGTLAVGTIAIGERVSTVPMGPGILSQVRTSGNEPVVDLLPMGVWASGLGGRKSLTVGRPLPDGSELVSVVSSRSIRIARAIGDRLVGAVELTSNRPFGAVPLVEPDGRNGYVVVFRLSGADRYRVVDVTGRAVRDSFDVPAASFASGLPFSRFRLAGNHLFQMTSDPRGLRIVRYPLPGVTA